MSKMRAGLPPAAVGMGGCVGGSAAGSLIALAAGFDRTGISGRRGAMSCARSWPR